jgi:hypothetical protein
MARKNVVALVALAILPSATVASEAQVFPGFGVGLGDWALSATPGRPPVFTRTWDSGNSSTASPRFNSPR